MNIKMKDNKTLLERSKTYLVAHDGEIEEDYGDVYSPDEGYQDFLNRNNRIIEMKNVDFYNRDAFLKIAYPSNKMTFLFR